MDIPKYYTALAEFLSCVALVIEYQRAEKTKCRFSMAIMGKLALIIAVLGAIQWLCGMTSGIMWIVGMIAAVIVMMLTILWCTGMDKMNVVYAAGRAFIKAEFVAALEWQIYCYYIAPGRFGIPVWQHTFCILFYLAAFFLIGVIENKLFFSKGCEDIPDISPKNAALVWIDVIIAFAMSNLSYIQVKTPFTGSGLTEIFNIRTLFDLSGLIMAQSMHLALLDQKRQHEVDAGNMIIQRQYSQYRANQENAEIVNKKYHDLKQQLAILRSENDDMRRLEYIDEIENSISGYEASYDTGNSVLDTILTQKAQTCIKLAIPMKVVADGTLLNHIHVMDLCTIFGNAIDNAIECEAQCEEKEKRSISVNVYRKNSFVCIVFANYFPGTLNLENGKLPGTTKKNEKGYHGYGLSSICSCVKKYGGFTNIDVQCETFRLEIMMSAE